MELHQQLSQLTTESTLDSSSRIDKLTVLEQLAVINSEDQKVAIAISKNLQKIAEITKSVIHSLQNNGRLIYIGAGTSGRIGILDAVECYPTYGLDKEIVIGIIAGGNGALFKSVEGAEDNPELAKHDLQNINLTHNDIVISIAASGRTPYCIGAIEYANQIGATSVGFSCNSNSPIGLIAKLKLEIELDAEVISGSTRMKSGTCQKLVLNMISTTAMINLGKVYKNLMVDVKASNLKLVARITNIFIKATNTNTMTANKYIAASGNNLKLAIAMYLLQTDKETAIRKLAQAHDKLCDLIG